MSTINMLPKYSTVTFLDVYPSVDKFINGETTEAFTTLGFKTSPFYNTQTITESNATILYYLLVTKYGNNPIANRDINQFMLKLFGVIWQYGPTWEKKLDIQDKLRDISEEDLIKGSKAIHNHAFNPSTTPSTSSLDELTYTNDQNVSSYKKSKMEAYSELWTLLRTDVTSEFLDKFKYLFKVFVADEKPLLYVEEDD